MQTGHSDLITEGLRVRVAAQYLPDHSDPDARHYQFVYRVVLINEGDRWAKLLRRHWIITDAHNRMEEVRGPGVIGEYPELAPGDSFEYMSGCPLPTAWGTIEGIYTFKREDGSTFDARIGRCFLAPTAAPITQI